MICRMDISTPRGAPGAILVDNAAIEGGAAIERAEAIRWGGATHEGGAALEGAAPGGEAPRDFRFSGGGAGERGEILDLAAEARESAGGGVCGAHGVNEPLRNPLGERPWPRRASLSSCRQ